MNKDRKLLVLPLVESKEFRVRQCKVTEGWNTQSFGPNLPLALIVEEQAMKRRIVGK